MASLSPNTSVIVTGGTGNLGQAVVARLLRTGAEVVVPWIAEHEVTRLRGFIGENAADGSDRLHLVEASVTDAEGVATVVEAAEALAPLRAGILLVGGFAMDPLAETDAATWDRLVALNATSLFHSARQIMPRIAGHGGGALVSVAAEPALDRGAPGMGAYAATKAAVVSLTQTLAREGASAGVTANAVAPRIIDTPPNRAAMPDADTSDWITPAEIAEVIAFLTGPAGEVVTANVLTLSRGER